MNFHTFSAAAASSSSSYSHTVTLFTHASHSQSRQWRRTRFLCCSNSSSSPASLFPGSDVATKAETGALRFEETKERIKQMFNKVELSISAYDTAWVAMVPSPKSLNNPLFPNCIEWILDNQLPDGSWGILHYHPLMMKPTLLSTLACLLALKRWNVGQEHMSKALNFIASNVASATDEKQHSSVGFDIIFPGMVEYAKDLNLNLPLEQMNLDALYQRKELELRSCGTNPEGIKAYLAYVSEGNGKSQDWEMVMKYQRKNGSLFNSPSTTAMAYIHLNDEGCFNYLNSLLQKFSNSVPAIYPLDSHARLCMVDCLQRLGIGRHFEEEIKSVLEETYRCWMHGDENIFLDASTCAMAFRMLRIGGYDVASDQLTQFTEHLFSNTLGGYLRDCGTTLELFKASQITMYPDETVLEDINCWTNRFLNHGLEKDSIHPLRLKQEVSHALEFNYSATMERLSTKRALENYILDNIRISKTLYSCLNFGHHDFLELAVEDFTVLRDMHRKELKDMERWYVENRLDKLKFGRMKLGYCYFTAAASLASPELCDARISWAKNGVLTTVLDDFYDIVGSEEELANLIQLVENWDTNGGVDYCSEAVEIIFLAIRGTICELENKALVWQGRSVLSHIIDVWLSLLRSMKKEADWIRKRATRPSRDEYIENAYVSFALGPIVLLTLYFVGPKLSEEQIRSSEYHNLYKLMSICGRILNDIQTYEKEAIEGKVNAISLYMIDSGGTITKEEANEVMKEYVERSRRELLRLVLQEKNSIIPKACKEVFWKMCCVVHLFYGNYDGFTSEELMKTAKALFEEPMILENIACK